MELCVWQWSVIKLMSLVILLPVARVAPSLSSQVQGQGDVGGARMPVLHFQLRQRMADLGRAVAKQILGKTLAELNRILEGLIAVDDADTDPKRQKEAEEEAKLKVNQEAFQKQAEEDPQQKKATEDAERKRQEEEAKKRAIVLCRMCHSVLVIAVGVPAACSLQPATRFSVSWRKLPVGSQVVLEPLFCHSLLQPFRFFWSFPVKPASWRSRSSPSRATLHVAPKVAT